MAKAKVVTKKKDLTKKIEVTENVSQKIATPSFGIVNVVAIIVVLVIFGLVGFWSSKNNSNSNTKQNVAAAQVVAYDGEDGKNALELLKNKAEIQTQDSSIGIFVVGINNISDSEDHFWLLYVNGELAQSTPDKLVTKNGDKLEWRFEQFNQ